MYQLLNVGTWPAKQFADQVNIRLISQLTNGISRVLQKLLRYFNGTIISTSFVSSFPVCSVIFCLILFKLNKILLLPAGKSIILSVAPGASSSLKHCHKSPSVFE